MKKSILLLSLMLLFMASYGAHDFSAVAPSGQTLYYSYTAGGVMLTFPANTTINTSGWLGYTQPSGALTVPATVSYGGTTYNVVAIHRYAFYGCTGLTSLTVPEGVTAIRQGAFSGCTSLDTISLPSTLDSLGLTAFYNCPLSGISCAAVTPPVAGNTTFGNVPFGTCTLWVPCTSIDVYSAAAVWLNFTNITSGGCNATVTVGANDTLRGGVSGTGTYVMGTSVVLTATAADGYFFACWNDGDTLNPRVVTLVCDTSFTALFFAMQRDTLTLYDTLTVYSTDTIHDTITVLTVRVDTLYVHDTLIFSVRDTLVQHDTILPTFFRLTVVGDEGGVGVGNAVLPAGSEVEIAALPIEGYRFASWDDGTTDNPRRVTVTGDLTFMATFATVGVDGIVGENGWTLSARGHTIVVDGVQGRTVALYDISGRRLYVGTSEGDSLLLRMTAAGVYLVSVDGAPARKVAVK